MKTSQETDKIYPAFAKMQKELSKAKKSSTNPHFKSNYADLTAVHEACEQALMSNGFFVTQGYGIEPKDYLYTRLVHTESGQWFESQCPLVLGKLDAQGVGSATTYYRRYSLVSMLNMLSEDDDGNAATVTNASPSVRYEKAKGGPDAKKASVGTLNEIKNLLDANPAVTGPWWEGMKKKLKVTKAQEMDEKQAKEILADLKTMEQ